MDSNDCLNANSFYFILTKEGYFLKTSSKEDFEIVNSLNQGDFLFSGILKNSEWLHFKLGQSRLRKRLSQLPVAKKSSDTGWLDVSSLDTKNCNSISEIKFGGRNKPETYENL